MTREQMRKTDRSEGKHRLMTSWPVLTLTTSPPLTPCCALYLYIVVCIQNCYIPTLLKTAFLSMCVCVRVWPRLSSDTIPSHLLPVICSPWPFFKASVLSWPFAHPARTRKEEILQLQYVSADKFFFFFLVVVFFGFVCYSKYRTCETKTRQLGDMFTCQSLITAFTCWFIYNRLKARFLMMLKLVI